MNSLLAAARRMLITRVIWFAIGLIAGVLITVTSGALAHNGGLAKDGCHNDKSVGERHWHHQDTRDRAGKCEKIGELHIRYVESPQPDMTSPPLEPSPELLDRIRRAEQAQATAEATLAHERSATRTVLQEATNTLERSRRNLSEEESRADLLQERLRSINSGEPPCLRERTHGEVELSADRWGDEHERAALRALVKCLAAGE